MSEQRTASLIAGAAFLRARWRWRALRGARLAAFQERRARQLVAYAQAHAPGYREHWRGLGPDEWRTLPAADKRLIMADFGRFNTRGISAADAMHVALEAERARDFRPEIDGLTVGLSSGTSGHRGLFMVSRREQLLWAGTILARTLHTLRREPVRVAFFLRANSNLYQRVDGRLVAFRYFDLLRPLDEALPTLNSWRPDIIVAPPSLLGMLADERAAGRLSARPERLISVAEVLDPHDEARLRDVFGAPVHQIYQCTEGLLAISCAAGRLHIQEDLAAVQCEPLDAAGLRCTPIVTDLWRTTQPIIRYRLNDILRLDPAPCPCGSPYRVIAAIEGRCDDLLDFTTRDGATRRLFPDALRRMVLLASDAIRDYQVIQAQRDQLRIHLEIDGRAFSTVAEAVAEQIRAGLGREGLGVAELRIEQGLLPRPAGAKRRRVWREG